MALTAFTTITHGAKDGARTIVPEGERVPANLFSKAELQDLKDQGLVGEPAPTPSEVVATERENEELRAKVEALEAELAAAKK